MDATVDDLCSCVHAYVHVRVCDKHLLHAVSSVYMYIHMYMYTCVVRIAPAVAAVVRGISRTVVHTCISLPEINTCTHVHYVVGWFLIGPHATCTCTQFRERRSCMQESWNPDTSFLLYILVQEVARWELHVHVQYMYMYMYMYILQYIYMYILQYMYVHVYIRTCI